MLGKVNHKVLMITLIFLHMSFLYVSCDKSVRETSYSVYGYVTDTASQMPLADAEIWAWDKVIAETDSTGYYKFVSWGGGIRMVITAKTEGYLPSTKEVFVPSGSSLGVDFELTKQ